MKNCLQCKNEFSPKRERARFCSDICRAKFHQNKKFADKQAEKIVNGLKEVELIEKGERAAMLFEELMKELGNPSLKSSTTIPPSEQKEIPANNTEVDLFNKKIEEQIALIEKEKIPPERDRSSIGRKSWRYDQQQKIEKLREQLKQV